MKVKFFHRARAHLKVSVWSLVYNELLTKNLPMFLFRDDVKPFPECLKQVKHLLGKCFVAGIRRQIAKTRGLIIHDIVRKSNSIIVFILHKSAKKKTRHLLHRQGAWKLA